MPKGGSGFIKSASRNAGLAGRGGGASVGWRFSNPGEYDKEIQDMFKSIYRSGVIMQRNSRGQMIDFRGSDAAIDKANARIAELAGRMAKDVQIYNSEAAGQYAQLREVWGKPVYVNPKDMREFRDSIQSGDTILVNYRGTKGTVRASTGLRSSRTSDAAGRAAEAAQRGLYRTEQNTNVGILTEANRTMNAVRASIWQRATDRATQEYFASQIYNELWDRYNKTERAAWRRRRNK